MDKQIDTPKSALDLACVRAGGRTALMLLLRDCGHGIKKPGVIYQWSRTQVPAEYCPDIEFITGVRCEELRPDIRWGVLRATDPNPTDCDREPVQVETFVMVGVEQ